MSATGPGIRWGSIPARAGETTRAAVEVPREGPSPRVRGKRLSLTTTGVAAGPSPRVRGKQSTANVLGHSGLRSIPARAGETGTVRGAGPGTGPSPRVRGKRLRGARQHPGGGPSPRVRGKRTVQRLRYQQVHPRACGGSAALALLRSHLRGPSPRVRGKPTRWASPMPGGSRSIPARAGETPALSDSHGGCGPSPRVRGKRGPIISRHLRGGSIPARAGETSPSTNTPPLQAVHPRACGGNQFSDGFKTEDEGPSPRVRGKQQPTRPFGAGVRSIPARAGETRSRPGSSRVPRVHPRACGGNSTACPPAAVMAGPSPRVRGKRGQARRSRPERGSIPARAGETPFATLGTRPCRVHPRACGGNCDRNRIPPAMYGPSPRVRGKLLPEQGEASQKRSIPARAGET